MWVSMVFGEEPSIAPIDLDLVIGSEKHESTLIRLSRALRTYFAHPWSAKHASLMHDYFVSRLGRPASTNDTALRLLISSHADFTPSLLVIGYLGLRRLAWPVGLRFPASLMVNLLSGLVAYTFRKAKPAISNFDISDLNINNGSLMVA